MYGLYLNIYQIRSAYCYFEVRKWRWQYPTNMFSRCRVGLPAARVGMVEVKMATYLHLSALQWPFGSNKGAQHSEG